MQRSKGSFSAKLRKRQSRAQCPRARFKRFKVQEPCGRSRFKGAKARFLLARRALHVTNVALHELTAPYSPEGPYTRRMSLYTSHGSLPARRALHATDVALHAAQRLLTRPKGITRDGCRFTRANGSLLAHRPLHATNVALHELRLLTRPKGITRDGCRLTRRNAAYMK